jgi:hypothetical protein
VRGHLKIYIGGYQRLDLSQPSVATSAFFEKIPDNIKTTSVVPVHEPVRKMKEYTLDDVAMHNSENDGWVVGTLYYPTL